MAMPTPEQLQYMQAHITDDMRPNIIAASTISIILAYAAVTLRFVARWRVRAAVLADDWWILVALVITTGFVASSYIMVHYGLGRHIILVTNPAGLVETVVAAEVLYCCSIVPIKFSILYLYHRIFPSKKLYLTSMAIGAFVLAYSVAQAIAMILQCIPLSSLWTGAPGRCLDTDSLFTSMAVLNVITDFMILALPIPFLWTLRVSRTRKTQLFGLFALGGCVCIFGIIRAAYVGTASHYDASWSDINGATWSIIEVCVGIVSACLPTLRPIFNKSVESSRSASSKGASDFKGYALPLSNKPKQGWSHSADTDTLEAHDDKRPFARLDEISLVDVDVEGGRGGGQPAKPLPRPDESSHTENR